jgi:hypothetical protein
MMTATTLPLDRLPAIARRKMTAVADSVADAMALLTSTRSRIRETEELLRNSSLDKDRANLEHELSRLRSIAEAHAQKHANRLQSMVQLQAALVGLPPRYQLVEAAPVQPRLQPGETAADAVVRVRSKIEEMKSELRSVQRASPTRDEQKQAAVAFVQELQRKYRPRVKAERYGRFEFDISDPQSMTGRTNPLAVLAWFDGDTLVKRLCAEIEALPKAVLTMAANDREGRIQEIKRDLLKSERLEEHYIADAALDGVEIDRRPMADFLAVLGVELRAVAATANENKPTRVERTRTDVFRGDAAPPS